MKICSRVLACLSLFSQVVVAEDFDTQLSPLVVNAGVAYINDYAPLAQQDLDVQAASIGVRGQWVGKFDALWLQANYGASRIQ